MFKTSPAKPVEILSVRPWTTIKRELVADCKVFSVHCQTSERVAGEAHDFYVFHPRNWVNVIPITADLQVVLIEQYRHGIEGLTLEIPGGMVDAEDASTLVAARRELLEETGYGGGETVFIGRNHPNPAIQSNICDTYLSLNVEYLQTPCFDTNEEVAIRMVPLKDIPALIFDGTISHALVIAAFHYLQHLAMTDARYKHLALWG
ncbi:MAG: NUDIX hydrolase [Candidatus Obscuribacter sp.]|nr:NUDIX hydrolase [Candidatus Obscuribacter sp.]MDQ5965619.1 hydrolase [Cyanobacteriota bacterium erpe_2018_sw_39hr_WHONDRS-SW48-000098_B_bin.30]MBK7837375.1 NUDIX hydrolase [Candidatus Obscuribacter sp.]MBK9206199.1 NUDIX hydrolase [Candidatus Obscuribacter sp.]MBK9618108.1 NUDIX hydrolase [Candidatus Obscuribacter sp.]